MLYRKTAGFEVCRSEGKSTALASQRGPAFLQGLEQPLKGAQRLWQRGVDFLGQPLIIRVDGLVTRSNQLGPRVVAIQQALSEGFPEALQW